MSSKNTKSGLIDNMPMAGKLSIIPVIILGLLIASGINTYINVVKIDESVKVISNNSIPTVELAFRMSQNTINAKQLVASFNKSFDTKFIPQIALKEQESLWIQAELSNYHLSAYEQTLVGQFKTQDHQFYTTIKDQLAPKAQEVKATYTHFNDTVIPNLLLNLQNIAYTISDHESVSAQRLAKKVQTVSQYTSVMYKQHTQSSYKRTLLETMGIEEELSVIEDADLTERQEIWLEEVQFYLAQMDSDIGRLHRELKELDQITHDALPTIALQMTDTSQRIQEVIWLHTNKTAAGASKRIEDFIKLNFLAIVTSILLAIVLIYILSIKITRPILALVQVMSRVQDKGDFSIRTGIKSRDEVGRMARVFDNMLAMQANTINEIRTVMQSVSQGVFTRRVELNLNGDFRDLKNNVNASINQLNAIFSSMNDVNKSLAGGDFSKTVTLKLQGQFAVSADSVNTTVGLLNEFVSETNRIMNKVSNGELAQEIDIDLPGDLGVMKNAINKTIQTINKTISDVSMVSKAQAAGDLTKSVTGHYRGTFHELKNTLNGSIADLTTIISKVKGSSDSVRFSTHQVLQGSIDLADRNKAQAAALEETAASLEEITATIQSNTTFSIEARAIAIATTEQSKEGIKIATKAQAAMRDISQSSTKIVDIIALIEGIAFQTNLLALNAAVEAARAGDHGRGFAVVAGEVGNLSQKSTEAASKIKTLITESAAQVERGQKLVTQTGDTLNDVNQSVDNLSSMIDSISSASTEQSLGISQINNAITEIDSITQHNSTLAEKTNEEVKMMRDEVDRMDKTLSYFKTEND